MEQIQIRNTVTTDQINIYIQAAWNLAYASFWDQLDFSILELESAREFISAFISNSTNPYENYLEFCQRVLMAFGYIKTGNGKYIPLPSIWFNNTNDKGFKGTLKWMDDLNCKRRSVPLYRIELKAMAEAVLEMVEEPTVANFRYWKTYLLERKQEWLYSLLISVVMNGMLRSKFLNQMN